METRLMYAFYDAVCISLILMGHILIIHQKMTISKNGNLQQKMKAIPFVFLPNSAIFRHVIFLMNLNPITHKDRGNIIRV